MVSGSLSADCSLFSEAVVLSAVFSLLALLSCSLVRALKTGDAVTVVVGTGVSAVGSVSFFITTLNDGASLEYY